MNLTAISLAPDVADALVGDRRVNDGVGDRAVAHKVLKRSCIDATGGKSVASSVPQHVSMDREWQLGGHPKPFYELLGTIDR